VTESGTQLGGHPNITFLWTQEENKNKIGTTHIKSRNVGSANF